MDCGNDPSLNFPTGMTIVTWVSYASLTGGSRDYIVSKDDWREADRGFVLRIGSSGTAGLTVGASGWRTVRGTVLESNRWYHIAATCDGKELKIYVDGAMKASAVIPRAMTTSPSPLRINRSIRAVSPGVLDVLGMVGSSGFSCGPRVRESQRSSARDVIVTRHNHSSPPPEHRLDQFRPTFGDQQGKIEGTRKHLAMQGAIVCAEEWLREGAGPLSFGWAALAETWMGMPPAHEQLAFPAQGDRSPHRDPCVVGKRELHPLRVRVSRGNLGRDLHKDLRDRLITVEPADQHSACLNVVVVGLLRERGRFVQDLLGHEGGYLVRPVILGKLLVPQLGSLHKGLQGVLDKRQRLRHIFNRKCFCILC